MKFTEAKLEKYKMQELQIWVDMLQTRVWLTSLAKLTIFY